MNRPVLIRQKKRSKFLPSKKPNQCQDVIDLYKTALRDALHYYDRITGAVKYEGWSAQDAIRLSQLREIAK